MIHEPRKMPGYPFCIALTIEFNPHAVYYQTVEAWIEDRESFAPLEWVNDEERQRAIETDSVWVCHWYPVTPVGSCELAASSYEALMGFINAHEKPAETES